MDDERIHEQVERLTDQTIRAGDFVAWADGRPGPSFTLDHVENGIAAYHRGTRTAPVAELVHAGGDIHINRRPGHPHCIGHDVAGCTARYGRGATGWVVIHAWPDGEEKHLRANWRWVQACVEHADLAFAFARDWVGPDGIVRAEGQHACSIDADADADADVDDADDDVDDAEAAVGAPGWSSSRSSDPRPPGGRPLLGRGPPSGRSFWGPRLVDRVEERAISAHAPQGHVGSGS